MLAPDVNISGLAFTVTPDSVRFGLAAMKNVGEGAILSILEVRAIVRRDRVNARVCARKSTGSS